MSRNGNLFATQSVRRWFPLWLWLLCIATILIYSSHFCNATIIPSLLKVRRAMTLHTSYKIYSSCSCTLHFLSFFLPRLFILYFNYRECKYKETDV